MRARASAGDRTRAFPSPTPPRPPMPSGWSMIRCGSKPERSPSDTSLLMASASASWQLRSEWWAGCGRAHGAGPVDGDAGQPQHLAGHALAPTFSRVLRSLAHSPAKGGLYDRPTLARNLVDAVQLVRREWQGRCPLKSVREPIDTTTHLGRMIFGVLAMFADFERAAMRDRKPAGKVQRIHGSEAATRPAGIRVRTPPQRARAVDGGARRRPPWSARCSIWPRPGCPWAPSCGG